MELIKNILGEIDTVSLSEMDDVKLLNRKDKKYMFHISKLPEILNSLQPYYKILDIKNSRNMDYETLYFDTHKFDLYHDHQRKKSNRYKVRYRKYVNTNESFLEIKFKNSEKRTIKTRIKQNGMKPCLNQKAKGFIERNSTLDPNSLEPVIWVRYSRITCVSKDHAERLTIDVNLNYQTDNGQKRYDSLVIAELKQQNSSKKSPFSHIMKTNGIKSRSISKYCLGVSQLYPQIESENYFGKIQKVHHILNGSDIPIQLFSAPIKFPNCKPLIDKHGERI